jgi:hypothetical protein
MKVTARQPRLWAPSGRISIHSPAPAGGPQNVTAVAPTGAVQVARGAGGCGYPEHPRLYPGITLSDIPGRGGCRPHAVSATAG